MVLHGIQQMNSFEVLKFPSGCGEKTGMDRPRVSRGPARQLVSRDTAVGNPVMVTEMHRLNLFTEK